MTNNKNTQTVQNTQNEELLPLLNELSTPSETLDEDLYDIIEKQKETIEKQTNEISYQKWTIENREKTNDVLTNINTDLKNTTIKLAQIITEQKQQIEQAKQKKKNNGEYDILPPEELLTQHKKTTISPSFTFVLGIIAGLIGSTCFLIFTSFGARIIATICHLFL